ncbi:MAG: gamma-glutamylcyclotransferase [Tissierellia bacterium]|nr:gamma-glutamylcyclotransferase [Tissierellia bacterium]
MNKDVKYLFVYGSLMEGFFNSEKALIGQVEKRIRAKTKGRLYHLANKGYPAMVDGDDTIYGELLVMKDLKGIFPTLNKIENYYGENDPKNEYNRVVIEVETLDGEKVLAYAYKYNEDNVENQKDEKIYIPDGDWREYMNRQGDR